MKRIVNFTLSIFISLGLIIAMNGVHALSEEVETFIVSVENGSGSGPYEEGELVTIVANPAPEGYVFDRWISGSSYLLDDREKATITFIMPKHNVNIQASYKFVYHDIENFEWNSDNTLSFDVFTGAVEYAVQLYDLENNLLYDNYRTPSFTVSNGRVTMSFLELLLDYGKAGLNELIVEIAAWGVNRKRLSNIERLHSPEFYLEQFEMPTGLIWNEKVAHWNPVEQALQYRVKLYHLVNGLENEVKAEYVSSTNYNFTNVLNEGIYFFTVTVVGRNAIALMDSKTAQSERLVMGANAHQVNVINGSGSALYQVGDTVEITADLKGGLFNNWSVEGVEISDLNHPTLSFIMPDNEVTLTVNYLDKLPLTLSGLDDNQTFFYTAKRQTPLGQLNVTDNKVDVHDLEVFYESVDEQAYQSQLAPINVGAYKVTYQIPKDNPEYEGSVTYLFRIEKADPTPEIQPFFSATQNSKLEEIILPDGFVWVNKETVLSELGASIFPLTYYPQDQDNYNVITLMVKVYVIEAPQEYEIILIQPKGGTLSANRNLTIQGAEVILSLAINQGYEFVAWDILEGPIHIENNRFIMPNSSVTISARLKQIKDFKPYTYEVKGGHKVTWNLQDQENMMI